MSSASCRRRRTRAFSSTSARRNYDNPEAEYVLQPGEENVRTYRHVGQRQETSTSTCASTACAPARITRSCATLRTGRRLSGSDVNQDHPVGGITAPENAGIGIPLAAHAPLSTDHHAINTTDQPLLQEVWVNFWYVDPSKVKETTNLLYDPGCVSTTIAPHADVVHRPVRAATSRARPADQHVRSRARERRSLQRVAHARRQDAT